MIGAISSSSVLSSVIKEVSSLVPYTTPAEKFVAAGMGVLKIRMDTQLDRAILEYRSSDGEVIRQYPTESQIKAFNRSAEIISNSEASSVLQQDVRTADTAIKNTGEETGSAPSEASSPTIV